MCDEQTLTSDIQPRGKPIHRRTLGKLGVGLALAAMLPRVANAQDVVSQHDHAGR